MSKLNVTFLFGSDYVKKFYEPDVLQNIKKQTNLTIPDCASIPNLADMGSFLQKTDVCVTTWGSPSIATEVLAAAPALKLVIHAGGSVKPIVSDEMFERGIVVTSGAAALGVGVAETSLGFIIMAMKNVFELAQQSYKQGWDVDQAAKNRVKEMIATTVGIVGGGHVGQHLLKLLQNFSARVLLYDPTWQPAQATAVGAELVDLDTLMKEADVISLNAPSIPATWHMIDARRLALMKKDATLINTARGSLIDEAALVTELATGRIRACIDVTDPEPPAADNLLLKLPNAIITPHIAGAVTTGLYRIGRYVADEIERYIAGKPAKYAVPREQLANKA